MNGCGGAIYYAMLIQSVIRSGGGLLLLGRNHVIIIRTNKLSDLRVPSVAIVVVQKSHYTRKSRMGAFDGFVYCDDKYRLQMLFVQQTV